MSNFKRFIITIICYFTLILPTSAAEIIEYFHSDITVNQDGSLTIIETIRVHHEGNQIRRGIYRDLATTQGEYYKILGVKRNDFPEPWFTERKDTALRLNTGDDELLPSPATSTFELSYIMYDALRTIRDENLNELYLNITGKWEFPIDKVEVDVHYPEDTRVVRQYAYQTSHSPRQLTPGSTFVFDTLPAGFEATIAQAFTQGTVNIPFAKIYKTLIAALMATLLYYLIMWALRGRDPQSLPIVPDWEAPTDLSPLDCAILDKQGSSPHNAFFIHVIWLLSRKILTMKTTTHKGLFNSDETYELTTNTDIAATQKNPETDLYLSNFPNFLRLTKNPSQGITAYQNKLITQTTKKLNKKYYNRHGWITFFGALIFPTIWSLLFPENAGLLLWCFGWGAGIIVWIAQRELLVATMFIIMFIPVVLACLQTISGAIMFAIYGTIVYIFNYLMFQPTFIGQRQIEKIAGLKMFLEAVTANQNMANADKRVTPEDMEQLFPYAVALGLEKAWSKKYEKIFGAAGLAQIQNNHQFYNTNFRTNLSSCCSKVTSYTSSSSGSGSHGGGHAGGGCGGGGGGGR